MSNIQNGVLREGQMQTFLGKMTAFTRAGKSLLRGTTPTTINNPQSVKQMYQRLKFLNLNNFYRAVAPFNRGGWESRPAGSSAFNAFMAANLAHRPYALTRAQQDAGMVVVAPYCMTAGSLPAIVVDTESRGEARGVSNILVGDLTISSATTVGEFAEAIVAANGGRFAYGDEIAFLSLSQYLIDGVFRVRTVRTAVTLIEDSSTTLADLDLLGFGVHNHCLALSAVAPQGGYCWVHARRDAEGRNHVSTQSLIVVGDSVRNRFSSPDLLRAAAEDYGASFGEDLFLECPTVEQREIWDAFGLRYRIVKNDSDSVSVMPSVICLDYAGDTLFPGDAAPVIDTAAAPTISVSLSDIQLLDPDSLAVRVNGSECTEAAIVLNAVTAKIPTSENGKALTSVSITSDTGNASAVFNN